MGFWKCFCYLAAVGIIMFFMGRILPEKWFRADSFPYRSYAFEKDGRIYDRLFGIRVWQHRAPDMSKIIPGLMPAKKLDAPNLARLSLMVRETCIAEFTHTALSLLGLHCLRLWPGVGGAAVALVYILLGNAPFILIQRYNRPRLIKLMKKRHTGGCGDEENGGAAVCAR